LNSTQFVDGKDRQAKTTPKITIEQTIIAATLLSQPAEKEQMELQGKCIFF